MNDFLELVARDLYRRFGNDLSHTVVLFPNKRASLFLNEYLGKCTNAPIWAPHYLTISELFTSLSERELADPIESVCRLYKYYIEHTGSHESLDYFYGWGERLLSDFDDIDKNMADAATLFKDLRDYAALGSYDYLDSFQIEQLKKLSIDFSAEKLTSIQQRFNHLWKVMHALYMDLRADLNAQGKAYEGQLYREVADGLEDGHICWPATYKHVAIVGFNVIDRVERKLFRFLQKKDRALFYWDYDRYYTDPHGGRGNEAGTFIVENLKEFPNTIGSSHFDNFLKDRERRSMEVACAQTELAQAQNVGEWLNDPHNFDPKKAKRTAIVICNERLLQPILHALPEVVGEVNVTKGFPLGHTPAFACVRTFVSLLEKEHDERAAGKKDSFKTEWPEGLACLPHLKRLQEQVKADYRKTLQHTSGKDILHDLYTESYFQVFTTIARLGQLVQDGLLQVQLPTLLKLLRNVLHNISVPFHGEPAVGLQVMGVLETRCLDFDNVLMLSVEEGTLPQKAGDSSFIPFLIRKMHRLTTPDRQVAVYAYYFYRLLQRATHVRLCYNQSTEGMQKGEMSRFIRALLVEGGKSLNIRPVSLEAAHRTLPPLQPMVGTDMMDFAERVQNRGLSPSALKSYFKCPLQFYYHYIKRLKVPQVNDGIINANDFGTVFHKAAENIYLRDLGGDRRTLTPEIIKRHLEDHGGAAQLEQVVSSAFHEVNEECVQQGRPVIPDTQVARHALRKYLEILLNFETGEGRHSAPARMIERMAAEQKSSLEIPVSCNGQMVKFKLYGYIDRRDEAVLPDGRRCLRIIDYKTGKKSLKDQIRSMDDLFTDSRDFPENALQVLIYSLMWADQGLAVTPMLYYIPSMPLKDFSPFIQIGDEPVYDFRSIASEFREKLTEKLSELLDPTQPFRPTAIEDHCKYCDYKSLCGR